MNSYAMLLEAPATRLGVRETRLARGARGACTEVLHETLSLPDPSLPAVTLGSPLCSEPRFPHLQAQKTHR